jgi:hypothetical protein
MLGPVGILTQAVSEVSMSSRRNNLRDTSGDNFGDNLGNNSTHRTLSETEDFLNVDWIMTVPLIDRVGALPAASLQDNF